MANAQKWRMYDEPIEGGKSAILYYQVLGTINERSLLAVRPITGRTHQIRAQMAYKGHPVVGDKKYGKTEWLNDFSLCLFSHRIQFEHPITKAPVQVTAPAPFHRDVWSQFKDVDIVI
jgi:23S rRNA pseudouridine1911/1915/1917 synthase